ncbi:alpha/beta fold hydrolase [Polyangium spumosum]|uniref:Alpha/beta fold hydrolase n=1 Tax=Polyangium spumosum TaxID=889282 RepID=A0A6N7PN87_9BACT|nr:alpha/beta hydrolase [Polyangium spumosum]MRG92266.1 alpha/beta fold hydrolase [Polyangium spumosum]
MTAITSTQIQTSRLRMHVLVRGPKDGVPVLFIHGNCSSARFYEETMAALPEGFRAIAADLRGYGDTEPAPIDATRGLRDFSDDLAALLRHPELGVAGKVHVVGWSVGGGVAMQLAIDHPELVGKIVLEAPMSPYGFGGTRGASGEPCFADFAGSGGGTANPEFARRLKEGDASEESAFSPRKVMNDFYFKPPFRVEKAREEVFVAEILKMRTGDDHYPGDTTTSTNWPGVAPGARGVNNALSPKYVDLSGFGKLAPAHDVLWIRGDADQIVSDTSLFDFGFLGKLGAIPGWPGEDVCPAQPMVAQTRAVLEAYKANGGSYREEILPNVGHSPHIEARDVFVKELVRFFG